MNTFTKRPGGPLPLMRARSIAEQSAQRERDDAWTAKMNRQLDDTLKRRSDEAKKTR